MTQSDLTSAFLVLIDEFQRSGMRELHVRSSEFELYLSNDRTTRSPLPGMPAAAAPAVQAQSVPPGKGDDGPAKKPAPASDLPEGAVIVRAPNLGTFYRSPKPGAAPYVELGAAIAPGDELCLIEVMKLFTSVTAQITGRIHAILVEDGAMVEADQPLFAVVA